MLSLDFLDNNYVDDRTPQEKAKEQIKIDILTRELRPGQRLIEQKLCERFGLSRPPLREIINQLASEGYVELIPKRGAFVNVFDSRMLDDLLNMRNLLYPQAVRWAIERITVDELEMLQETFGFIQFYTPTGDIPKLKKFTAGFDAIIYDSSKNRELIDKIFYDKKSAVYDKSVLQAEDDISRIREIIDILKSGRLPDVTEIENACDFSILVRAPKSDFNIELREIFKSKRDSVKKLV